MRVVVSYDITSGRLRTRVSHILKGYTERVQRSVFEGEMSMRQLQHLRGRLGRVSLGATDSIRYYLLCNECGERVMIDGAGSVVRAPKYFVV